MKKFHAVALCGFIVLVTSSSVYAEDKAPLPEAVCKMEYGTFKGLIKKQHPELDDHLIDQKWKSDRARCAAAKKPTAVAAVKPEPLPLATDSSMARSQCEEELGSETMHLALITSRLHFASDSESDEAGVGARKLLSDCIEQKLREAKAQTQPDSASTGSTLAGKDQALAADNGCTERHAAPEPKPDAHYSVTGANIDQEPDDFRRFPAITRNWDGP